ncbi:MAG: transglutaminase family protein [Bacteroidia bacterium]|nr:transglutaminase family protein [Bacteroidia bacterium]
MPKFKIRHLTKYTYEGTVSDSANQVMLYPVKDEFQEVVNHSISITGNPAVEVHTDHFGNEVGTFTHTRPHRELTIDSRLLIVTKPHPLPQSAILAADQWKALEKLRFQIPFLDFLICEHFSFLPELVKLIEDERCKDCPPLQTVQDFCQYIYSNFTYQKGITTVETTVEEIWKLKSGVCQDFAHLRS